MSLQSIIDEFDKEAAITTEQLASQLMNKQDLSLKTEIPFNKAVWHTALRKDMCDLVGILFNNVKVIKEDTKGELKLETYQYEKVNEKGEKIKVNFGQEVATDLKRQIGYSEEYSVSYKRRGRIELTSVLGKKMEHVQARVDTLSRVMGK